MHSSHGKLIFSATDLSNFLSCPHLSLLDLNTALGGPKPPKYDDPSLEVLWQRGLEHEQEYLESLRSRGNLRIVEVTDPGPERALRERWERIARETSEAMASGADVIYQGGLFDGTWLGRPDFLQKVDRPSLYARWSYEVVDTKLAREAKGGAVLQICLYSDLLEKLEGAGPEHMHLALGGPNPRMETFRVADYAAYYRSVRSRFLEAISAAEGGHTPVAPEPAEHCQICAWKTRCDRERREVDHLSLVAGITRKQRAALAGRGIETVTTLAQLPLPINPRLDGVSDVSALRIREQARIQIQGRVTGRPCHELLQPIVEDEGLAALPEPSSGDLFFDIESDPYALQEGLEYLFGVADRAGEYTAMWALDREAEEATFETFIDLVVSRLAQYPNLHVYHYAPYEPTALKRLMGRHATREDELDRLLRGKIFVDLYRVVRQGVRASVESYSIKKMEPFYGFDRDVELREASSALAHFEAWLELGGKAGGESSLLQTIQGYNQDDCISTLRLRDWLETLREQSSRETGHPVPRPTKPKPEPSEELAETQQRVAEFVSALTAGIPADEEARTADQHARWLLAQLLGWHRREKKSMWWEYFRWLELSEEELLEDRSTMGGLTYVGVVDTIKRSYVHRYHFPRQEHDIGSGSWPVDPATGERAGHVVAVDEAHGTIDLKRGKALKVPHPNALVPLEDVRDDVLRASLIRLADAVLLHGFAAANPLRAAIDLLLRRPPHVGQIDGESLVQADEELLSAARRLVHALDRSVLPIQGPPGSGKTYSGARMILGLLQAGKRVGITATSHKVIGNLLEATCEAAREAGFVIAGIQKADEDQRCVAPEIMGADNNAAVRDALADGSVQLAAGTAWLWSREEMAHSVDVLFVDEAGQLSLANTLAVSQAAPNLVLLGDPRQLEQPQRGVHPPGADVSALDHLLAGELTVPPDRGLFLDQTWRLHPDICAFTSELFYRDRLESRPGLELQAINGSAPVVGSGLRLLAVPHTGNQNESAEEVQEVARLVGDLLASGATWTTMDGKERPVTLDDIPLVVAPYNAQVSALAERLPDEARVGTVDKFQGQEAPITIYSMSSSSAEDAPRGMEFLYSPNRLNVATSRARCVAVVVASPDVFVPECRSPLQMRLANAFCRYREMAGS